MSALCRHGDNHHLNLIVTGSTLRSARSFESATGEQCALEIFMTDKRFLHRDFVDMLYYKFSGLWLECEASSRDAIGAPFKRILMTRSFFVFVAYVYLCYAIWIVVREHLFINYIGPVSWDDLETRVCSYPMEKFDALLDNMNLQHLNELHRHVFGTDLRIPLSSHVGSPCMCILRSKDYECGPDVSVFLNSRAQHGCLLRRCVSDSFRDASSGGSSAIALVCALRRRARLVVSGNPFYVMARSLVEAFCRVTPRYLIPLGKRSFYENCRTLPGESAAAVAAAHRRGGCKITMFGLSVSLRNGIISSLIEVPVLCYCKVKCERYNAPGALTAILCKNCGHCLNLGKEKLNCGQGFPLNSMFYYRDRQEKSVIYSTHSELAYCSLCGSQYLTTEKIYGVEPQTRYGFPSWTVSWKVVSGSNSVCGIYGDKSALDVIVPCFSRTCYSTVIVKDCTADRLLRLLSHGNEIFCQLCQNVYRETCADEEERGGAALCVGCEIYQRFNCRVRRDVDA